jgi:selenocysteine-specific elongation factor
LALSFRQLAPSFFLVVDTLQCVFMTTDLILGTAGHIDHGKTALVKALTGADTDRLPEEKARGITVDLGFAELTLGPYRLGIVDVPGHERFVRNMLAGATGIDLALLVVAADDSIKPQTQEHLDILRLLNLKTGVIALTKCDLVEADWLGLVEEEVRDLVADTFFQRASPDGPVIVRTSSVTGQGIDHLRHALQTACEQATAERSTESSDRPFRMAIDRAFTISGFGTVVTGSVGSGAISVGDELVIEPGNLAVRVRNLQNHDRTTNRVQRGQRAAMNLAGIHHEQIQRGHELGSPGHLQPSRLLTIRLRTVEGLPRPVKNRSRVRVHVGTAELLATLVLLDQDQLGPGDAGMAQLFLADAAVTTWNQPLVLRSESPVTTIGGGHVLLTDGHKLPRRDADVLASLARLESPDAIDRAAAALYFAGTESWEPATLARTAGIEDIESVTQRLRDEGLLCEIAVSPKRTMRIHHDVLNELSQRIERALNVLHDRFPLRMTMERSSIEQRFSYVDRALLNHIFERMRRSGTITLTDRQIGLTQRGPKLSSNERKLLQDLIQQYRQAGLETPTVSQIQKTITKNQNSVPQLIELAAANGDLVKVAREYFLHVEVDQQLRSQLTEPLATGDGLTLSQIREVLGTSRKYAVPYCEYLDRSGFTRRVGDLRSLAETG